jgi:chemotaxis protein MotA
LVVDGTEAKAIREILEIEVEQFEEENNLSGKVYESLGGYSPTIGILGAVLGLIHVMENLADPSKLGSGIATAFVATIYGVGAANLFFLPMGGKIKMKTKELVHGRIMIIEGLVSLAQAENPKMIEEKLYGYLPESQRPSKEAAV